MRTRIDLTGMKYGRLTVIGEGDVVVAPAGGKNRRWMCQCECGSEPKLVYHGQLISGRTLSCGCYHSEQMIKLHSNFITYNGETHNIDEWAKKIGMSPITLSQRLRAGWSVERALTEPTNELKGSMNKVEMPDGSKRTIYSLAKEYDMKYTTLHHRLRLHGWPVEKALSTPVRTYSKKGDETDE